MEKQAAEELFQTPEKAAELQRHFDNNAGLVALEAVLVFSEHTYGSWTIVECAFLLFTSQTLTESTVHRI